jgi:hypothetical protein
MDLEKFKKKNEGKNYILTKFIAQNKHKANQDVSESEEYGVIFLDDANDWNQLFTQFVVYGGHVVVEAVIPSLDRAMERGEKPAEKYVQAYKTVSSLIKHTDNSKKLSAAEEKTENKKAEVKARLKKADIQEAE